MTREEQLEAARPKCQAALADAMNSRYRLEHADPETFSPGLRRAYEEAGRRRRERNEAARRARNAEVTR